MTRYRVSREAEAGRVVLRFNGDFDRASALDLRETISALDGSLLLDFSQVRDLDDLGLATLARLLTENRLWRFALRGLRRRQLRLLRYLGMEVDEVTGAVRLPGSPSEAGRPALSV